MHSRTRIHQTDLADEQAIRILKKLHAAGSGGFRREAGKQGHANVARAATTESGRAFLAKAESAALLGHLTANKLIG